ncbi:MAG TPA: glycoside hydrolase family 20 zincin-like fold domain-containing protein, partial [Verrucomicrobiae bacterium]|nr:glycoside hydrolase family 20 zincin-like fold domain-containing protein [Verrucomicrobiae bacterium]
MPCIVWNSLPGATAMLAVMLCAVGSCETMDNPETNLGLVPKPVSVEVAAGFFSLNSHCRILYQAGSPDAEAAAELLARTLRKGTGLSLTTSAGADAPLPGSFLVTTTPPESKLGAEGYRLEVGPSAVKLSAPGSAGLFYGIQTLHQLLPGDTYGSKPNWRRAGYSLPCVRITDYPRFAWRGMHLDVSRHFFDVKFIKRYLDNLALHKMNVFH